jgi:hypothetical protein
MECGFITKELGVSLAKERGRRGMMHSELSRLVSTAQILYMLGVISTTCEEINDYDLKTHRSILVRPSFDLRAGSNGRRGKLRSNLCRSLVD